MDDADVAQKYETLDREEAVFLAARSAQEEQLKVGGKVFCLGCGEPISAKRLAAVPDACRCTECQQELEG